MHVDRLETERLVLEPLSLSHAAGMFLLWSDPEVCRYSGPIHDADGRLLPSPVRTSSQSDRLIDFWVRARSEGWGIRWAVCERSSGSFMGTTGFNSLDVCAEYAYHLHPSYWGRGFMSEATLAALEWVGTQGATAVEAHIEPANTNSIRLVERHGFAPAGHAHDGTRRFLKNLG